MGRSTAGCRPGDSSVVVDPGARVVVTGATGFVGRHVLHVLEQRGIPFVAGARVRQVLQLNFHRQLSK